MVTAVSESDAALERRRPGGLATAWTLISATAVKAWHDRVLGLSAEAGFWQLLSLPSMLLGVLGVIGFLSGSIGAGTVHSVENAVLGAARHVIVPSAVDSTVRPALDRILAGGRADVVSVSFVISLWTGSSAMATYVNTITIAYGLRAHRHAVRSRIVALFLYIGFVIVGIVLLPLLILGPTLVVRVFPSHWERLVHDITVVAYWPAVALISLALLTTLYHLAIPVRIPWRRAVPGAVVGLLLWIVGSTLLREWLEWAFRSTATYGPFSAPIAVLLFLYLTALAILIGAELNAQIDLMWPLRETEAARLEDEQAAAAGG